MIFKMIYRWGDKLEDKVRGRLSHFPIIYAFIGGAGVIIFWRGIWHTMDTIMAYFFLFHNHISSTTNENLMWWDGPLSILIGTILLLATGLFVTSFIGNEIIISGLKGEKRVAEKSAEEIKEDVALDVKMQKEFKKISDQLTIIEKKVEK